MNSNYIVLLSILLLIVLPCSSLSVLLSKNELINSRSLWLRSDEYATLYIRNNPKCDTIIDIKLINGSSNLPFLDIQRLDTVKYVKPGSYAIMVQSYSTIHENNSAELYMLFEPNKYYELGYDVDNEIYFLNEYKI